MIDFKPARRLAATATAVLGLLGIAAASPAQAAPLKTDFVFIVDATGPMAGEINGVRAGFANFVAGLNAANVDARFAVVVFGGAAELTLDFTSDANVAQTALNNITIGPNPTIQNNHNINPEAGLEAIRMVLGGAVQNELVNDNIAANGNLYQRFRNDARKNLILATDEDSDRPFHINNRFPGQTSNEPPSTLNADWQAAVDATAAAAIQSQAFLNMLVGTDAPTKEQYGDFSQDVSDPDLLNYDEAATLTNLQNAGFGDSLQAQVLDAGLVAHTFNISGANNANFVDNFFAAKLEEVTTDPGVLPEAGSLGLFAVGLIGLGVAMRRRRTR